MIRAVSIKTTVAAVLASLALASGAHAANWGNFNKTCIGNGVAKYSAVLHGIPFGLSWEQACARQGAVINGQRFARPARCVNARTAMWGEFHVRDNSCRQTWGSFKDNGCVNLDERPIGMRSYSAVLWNVPPGQSWEAACANQPVSIAGYNFRSPTVCVKADMKDAAQALKTASKVVAKVAKAAKEPRVYLAARTTALVAGVVGKINPALNIWGIVYVPDNRCPAR